MMNFVDTALTDRLTELNAMVDNYEKIVAELNKDLNEANENARISRLKMYSINTILTNWFTEHLEDNDYGNMTVDLDDVNELMGMLEFDKIVPIRTWAVEVEYSGTGTVYVKAASEEEAIDIVNDESIHVEYCGNCEDSEFLFHDSSLNALSAEISS